ncbi:hypothetical protein FPANT_10572 [Fusarium pseudoanthophilum]|uniref:Ubiquitin-like domain-containing protein n=1 Tax=Fusarium pseudoanthophilum TaxID=48495 RepID=A0A8H5NVD0_9HYPO|nr:hypothetical protein FPANT_10572 [Fusarium pseudoanthophilum]
MEVTFGAVGDFISIGVLIKDFIELLDDSRGSAWEYKSLKQQLTFLRLILDLAKRSYDEYYCAPQFYDIRKALDSVVDEAERRLEGIAVKVQKYTSTLSKGSTERKIKKVARKVQWSLEKKETEKFLLDLHRYTSIIQSLQFNAFARLMERNFDTRQKDHSDTQELMSKLQKDFGDRFSRLEDEVRASRAMSANTQQYLVDLGIIVTRRLDMVAETVNTLAFSVLRGVSGMSYLGTSVLSLLSTMHSNIMGRLERPPHMGPYFTFEDYLGVDSIILLHFVDSWNAFEGSLHGKFKGRKGGRRVAQNRFLLQHHQTGDEIDRDAQWSLAITPGSRINMSLICEVNEDEDEAQSLKCPFPACGAICEGVIGSVIQCPSCQQLFRKLPGMSDDEDLPAAPNAPDSGIDDPNMKSGRRSSDLGQSFNRKGVPLDKRGALRVKRKPTDTWNTDSDSDDADLTGIKRVTVLPILRLPIRPSTPDSKTDRKFKASGQQVSSEEQDKSCSLDNAIDNASADTPSSTIESRSKGKNKGTSDLQSGSDEEHVLSGTAYLTTDGHNRYPYGSVRGPRAYVSESMLLPDFESEHPRRDTATGVSSRLSTSQDKKGKRSVKSYMPKARKATAADAKKHSIPAGYSLKHWDPTEKPILLLGSVFDANSLGKWVYDWAVYVHGPSTQKSDLAGEFWLVLIQLAGKVNKAEKGVEKIKSADSKEWVKEFIEAGERLFEKLKSLLRRCEPPMMKASLVKEKNRKNIFHKQGSSDDTDKGFSHKAKTESDALNQDFEETTASCEGFNMEETGITKQDGARNAGVAFIKTIFGQDQELEQTKKWMRNIRLFNFRFDAHCDNILNNPELEI